MNTKQIQIRLRRSVALAVVVAILSCELFIAGAAELPPSVDEYASALSAITSSRGRQSLEELFEIAIKSAPHVQAILDTLSPGELAALRKKMPGMQITRAEPATVRPSAAFFAKLARRKGDKADRAFFAIYERSEPDSSPGAPAYIALSDGRPGCTRFDGPLLVALYRGWLSFRTEYPDAYATEAQGEIDSLDAELAAGTCACASRNQVAAGFEEFIKAFPDLPLTQKVRARLDRIKAGTSQMRFGCRG